MTSKIKVDNINKVSDDSNIIKKCGTTVTVGAASDGVRTGADNLQAADGGNLISQSGTTITLGASGDTIQLAGGASQTGFGRSGSVNWQTTPKTATFTAADGEGYFINSGSAITMNLPAGSAGAIVAVSDYARNFGTYNLTISANGSEKIGGQANDATLNIDGQAATFVYVDSTKGWVNVQNAEDTETGISPFIEATGGTITNTPTCRIHTFTGPGTFTVNKIATTCAAVNNLVSYMIIGGGGGGGGSGDSGGGGGAGGLRELVSPGSPYSGSPLNGYPTPGNRITVTATSFPITVGAGGTVPGGQCRGGAGSTSSGLSLSAHGGGGGGVGPGGSPCGPGGSGGSGGGGGSNGCSPATGGAGNTPPVSPAQGNAGGDGRGNNSPLSGMRFGGGGGGATAVGANAPTTASGSGGAGATSSINASAVARAGGGGGGAHATGCDSTPATNGGAGGGGAGGNSGQVAAAGTVNTGGGGGGATSKPAPSQASAAGGSGIVIIRYKFQ